MLLFSTLFPIHLGEGGRACACLGCTREERKIRWAHIACQIRCLVCAPENAHTFPVSTKDQQREHLKFFLLLLQKKKIIIKNTSHELDREAHKSSFSLHDRYFDTPIYLCRKIKNKEKSATRQDIPLSLSVLLYARV